jgi:hypothetical protein
MVVIDATVLLLFVQPAAHAPKDADGNLIFKAKERVQHLIEELDHSTTTVIVPAPSLSEALVSVSPVARQQIVDGLSGHAVIRVEPFDQRAAIEMAAMLKDDLDSSSKKAVKGDEIWAKVKFDRQIVAIAKVCGAATIYSDDRDIKALGARAKIQVVGVADLPLPESANQLDLEGITQ